MEKKRTEEQTKITVHTLSEYVEAVSKTNAALIRNGANKNEVLLFRGHSDDKYELMPSIGRNRRCISSINVPSVRINLD